MAVQARPCTAVVVPEHKLGLCLFYAKWGPRLTSQVDGMCRDWYNFLGIQATLPADLRDQLTQAPGTLSQVNGISCCSFIMYTTKMHADEAARSLVLRNAGGQRAWLEGRVAVASSSIVYELWMGALP